MTYKITDRVRLDSGSAVVVYEELSRAFEKYGKSNVEFEVDTECEYGDYYARCYLLCVREMTVEEKQTSDSNARKQQLAREEFERKQYEQLKKKFGK